MRSAISAQEKTINCEIHGAIGPATRCGHLAGGRKAQRGRLGRVQAEFHTENREPGDLMGWCSDFDRVHVEDDGWNGENDSRFKVVCELCFLATLRSHPSNGLDENRPRRSPTGKSLGV